MKKKVNVNELLSTAIVDYIESELQEMKSTLDLNELPLEVESFVRSRFDFNDQDLSSLGDLFRKINKILIDRNLIADSDYYEFVSYTDNMISMQGECKDYVENYLLGGSGYGPGSDERLTWNELLDKFNISAIEDLTGKILHLVPDYGKADTVAGELFRACRRIIYRMYNDGDTGLLYRDGSFIDACNLYDYLSKELPDDTTKEMIKYYYSTVKKVYDFKTESLPELSRFDLTDHPYGEFPVEASAVLCETLFSIICDNLKGDDELIQAIKNKDVTSAQQLVNQGKVVKIDHTFLMSSCDKDLRKELYYSDFR